MRTLFSIALGLLAVPCQAADRPNIVWISCEDISSHLGCYGDRNATTPNLDAFAKEGVRYTQAFTCHGVCAPSRTGIITAMYPIALGANHMRSDARIPDHVKCFPEYLRKAGYYCTNHSKQDYNFGRSNRKVLKDVWDESSGKAHWKNRPNEQQPFFAVFNLTISHESKIWPKNWEKVVKDVPSEMLHDPNRIEVPRLYPEVSDVREAHARLLDIIMVMDRQVGQRLKEIDDAGLANDTIVIFWSDHGNGFPRAKRWIYDSGTLVPMIARIPEQFRVDGQGAPNTTDDHLINLIDLGPTMLNLAGVQIPKNMQGQPFLGPNLPAPRPYIYGARDRIDERFDLVRSVRDSQYRYVRNLNAWRPALQHIQYAETSVVRQQMRSMDAEGKLQPESAQFLHAPRAPEELYDLHADPWELHNLAGDPAYASTLEKLRAACSEWQLSVGDAHLIPESILDEEEKVAGSRWAVLHESADGADRLSRLLVAAETASSPTPDARASLLTIANSKDAAERWWAIHGLANMKASDPETVAALKKAAKDDSPAVRVAAGRALCIAGHQDEGYSLLQAALLNGSEFVRHAAINEIDELGPAPESVRTAIKAMKKPAGYIGSIVQHVLAQ